jgi:lipoate-protein ligase B
MPGICEVQRLGLVSYEQAWRYQEELAGAIQRGEQPPTLLLLEHPHSYTFGRRGRPENLLWDASELEKRGINVYWTDRGGDVTYHGPGQLVGYPLISLGSLADQADVQIPRVDYVGYLRRLEEVLFLTLRRFGIQAMTLDGLTGVWVHEPGGDGFTSRPAKIGSIGVKVDAFGVTRHGFALNVNPQMEYWQGIHACGLKETPAASLADLVNPPPEMEDVVQAAIEAFGQVFDYVMKTPSGLFELV